MPNAFNAIAPRELNRNLKLETTMNYRPKHYPQAWPSAATDQLRAGLLLKLGHLLACTVIAIGATIIAAILFPGLFH